MLDGKSVQKMIVAGIDPGKTGALFVTDFEALFKAYEVPLLKIKGKERPDWGRLYDRWVVAALGASHVFIELVGARPGQGVTSMFSFGYTAGFMYGVVCPYPHTFLTPQRWKKIVGISGSDGDESRRRASQLFPQCNLWSRKKDHGVAEAALIAYAGAQLLKGTT
jgi:hypothetical protein